MLLIREMIKFAIATLMMIQVLSCPRLQNGCWHHFKNIKVIVFPHGIDPNNVKLIISMVCTAWAAWTLEPSCKRERLDLVHKKVWCKVWKQYFISHGVNQENQPSWYQFPTIQWELNYQVIHMHGSRVRIYFCTFYICYCNLI